MYYALSRYLFLIGSILILALSCQESVEADNSNSSPNLEEEDGVISETETDVANDSGPVEDELPEVADFCETKFSAYLYDPGESFTNVRNAPNGDIIMELPWGEVEEEYMLNIIGFEAGWFKIADPIMGIYDDIFIPNEIGWVHSSVVACDTRNYANQTIELYQKPDEDSEVTGTIDVESGGLRPLEACGDWILIELVYDDFYVKGWIKSTWLCGNPLTTCA